MSTPRVSFYFDIVCPYAYIASHLVHAFEKRNNVIMQWKPVLLGGLYRATAAPQGAAGSATDVMAEAKRAILSKDLIRQARRYGVPLAFPSFHPAKTLHCQRVLSYLANDISEPHVVANAARALYKAYWLDCKDVSDPFIVEKVIKDTTGIQVTQEIVDRGSDVLHTNTDEAVGFGAFGVPSFVLHRDGLTPELFWGGDRLPLLEHALGRTPTFHRVAKKKKVTFYFDFSSPWSFLGYTQIRRVAEENHAEIEWVPILLGALFKSIGTPNMPALAMAQAKREYGALDMTRWSALWNEPVVFPDQFPIRTVTPLRVAIVCPETTDALYRAAWQHNRNIGDVAVLTQVLTEAGFDAKSLLEKADGEEVKAQLRNNTQRAIDNGVCGVPTFQVGNVMIWGQDRNRLDMLADVLCGYNPDAEEIHCRL